MRKYELVVVMRPSVKDADRKKLIGTIKEWLNGIKIVKEDDWGQKPLAYSIKKETAGYYYLLQLESEQEGIPVDLETKIFRQENVIRHLMLRTK